MRAAQAAGLSVCSGGLIGLGEKIHHRIELALTLRELDVESVPVNILNPIPGTPLAEAPPLPPLEILTTIAIFRFLLPAKDIKLCGGKEKNLRQLLPPGDCRRMQFSDDGELSHDAGKKYRSRSGNDPGSGTRSEIRVSRRFNRRLHRLFVHCRPSIAFLARAYKWQGR